MKLPVAVAAFAVLSTPALADCTEVQPNAPTYVDDPPTASVFFDAFLLAAAAPTQTCALVTPAREGAPVPPAGEISAYSADYRGFVLAGEEATLTVTENGVTRTVTFNPTDADFADLMLHSYVGSESDGNLTSDITLSGPNTLEDGTAGLDSVDYILLATTSIYDQRFSIEAVSAARTAVVTHLNSTAGLVVGANQPLERDDEVAAFGAVGSHTVGGTAHFNLGEGFSLDGGVALFDQSVGGADASGVLLGAKAGYLQPDNGSGFRWLGSAGFTAAPGMELSFSREYLDTSPGGEVISGDGSGSGNLFGIWIEGGVLVAPAPDDEIVFSASLARNWLDLDYAEQQTDTNPFALSLNGASTYDTAKAKAAWTTLVAPDVDLTLHGAVGYINANDDLAGNVALVGPLSVGSTSEAFVEYGARVGWAFAEQARWDVFALGSTGTETGTHVQVGTAVRMKF